MNDVIRQDDGSTAAPFYYSSTLFDSSTAVPFYNGSTAAHYLM
jgi:hypothetical protein